MSTTRTLHLIDLENLHGGSGMTADSAARVWRAYRDQAVAVQPTDHVVVGTGPRAAGTSWFGLPAHGIQRVLGHGPDGAELAILAAVDLAHAARRFDRLVVASGDHLFAPLAVEARRLGMRVHAVIGRGLPAQVLLDACPNRTWLGERGRSRLEQFRRIEEERLIRRIEHRLAA